MTNTPEPELLRLCMDLGLQYEPQDWGIANADGGRLAEFIEFFQRHTNLSASQRFELGELILASANEALRANEKLDDVVTFLRSEGDSFQAHLDYWRTLDDIVEFPLGEWLRRSLPHHNGS